MQRSLLNKNDLKHIKARTFGGVNLKKRRKTKRPLREKLIHHVVFKSSKARGPLSLYKHKVYVRTLLNQRARKHFVEIKDFVNMGNHLHIKVKFLDRKHFSNFLRTFSAILARKITGAHRSKSFGKFWDGLVYTRILTSRFEELQLKGYFEANVREREFGEAARDEFLKSWNKFIYRLRRVRARREQSADTG